VPEVTLCATLWLPKFLRRRYAARGEVDREWAEKSRRNWLWAVTGRAAGAAIVDAVMMAVVLTL